MRSAAGATGPPLERSAVVIGARGLVGHYLVPLLLERGFAVQAISRQVGPSPKLDGRAGRPEAVHPGSLRWVSLDLATGTAGGYGTGGIEPARCLFHAAPLWLLPAFLPAAAEAAVERLVAFSSTSLFTKQLSASAAERHTARRLAEAETAIEGACRKHGIRWTMFRPTLIYGGGLDRNVSDIARFVRRFGFFPIAGEGRGQRQPVHAADLATAALAVLDNPATFDRTYEVPGGETITYSEMVSRIALGVGRRPRLLHLPLPLLRGSLGLARRLPGLGHVASEMADRMNDDLVFDATAARRDFGYDPRPFRFPGEPDAHPGP
jgi:nucleoside-diphosphate-sugar epimerase